MTTIALPADIPSKLRNGVSAVVVAAILASCGETGGSFQNTLDNLFTGYIDENDVCVDDRRDMADAGALFDQDTLRRVGTSIFIGVVAGLVTGDVATGIAAGAISLAGLYLADYIAEDRSANDVSNLVREDVRASNERIDNVVAAFRNLDQCRRQEAAAIRSDLRNGRIDRATARARMTEVRDRRQEDLDKFREIAGNIGASSATYASAYNEIAADNGRRGFDIAESGRITRGRSVPAKEATEEGSLAGASSSNLNSLQRDCLTNVRKRDDCFDVLETAESQQSDFDIPLEDGGV